MNAIWWSMVMKWLKGGYYGPPLKPSSPTPTPTPKEPS